MNFQTRRLFASETHSTNPAFIDVVEFWEARVSAYNDDIFARYHCYKHVVASCLNTTIGAQDIFFLMQEGTTATREQLRISRIFFGAALHAPFNKFGVNPSAGRFYLPSAFTTISI